MKPGILLIVLIGLLIPAVSFSATYYVDPTASGGGNGSYARPWNTIAQVNSHKFSNGDDLYFKVGTRLEMTKRLSISWDGTASNRVVIGAYYGEGKFGLGSSGKRPVLRGSFYRHPRGPHVPSTNYGALVEYARPGAGYITVQDLEVVESYTTGIKLVNGNAKGSGSQTSQNIVRNCVVKNSGGQGIVFDGSWYGRIENNRVEASCLRPGRNPKKPYAHAGGAIAVLGLLSRHNTVKGNTVYKAFEGIGVYRGPRYTDVKDNHIYDFTDVAVYYENTRYGTISGNLIYNPSEIWWKPYRAGNKGMQAGIQVDSEGHLDKLEKVTGDFEIHDNFIAACKRGINVSSKSNRSGTGHKNTKVYENRIVDSSIANIACSKGSGDKMDDVKKHWANNRIFGNYSFIYAGPGEHVSNPTWPGVTWDRNYYNSKVDGDAAHNAKINVVGLKKKTGWRNLTPGSLKASDFQITGETSSDELKPVSGFKLVSP